MEILVTGHNGFLGKSIIKELGSNYNLISLARTSGDYKVSLEKEIPEFNQKFDLVIHVAGKAHSIPSTLIEEKEFFDVNVLGAHNLLQGLTKVGMPKEFVLISSVSVYGQVSVNAINETHALEAKDPYGLSKIESEILVSNWCEKNNVICTILRLPLVVDKNPPGNLGAMLRAINKGYYFNIGGGKARKSMVLAQDVASFIQKVAPVGGIYNLTDSFHPSFNELSKVISQNAGKRHPLNMSLTVAKFLAKSGDFLGNKAPINSLKIKKMTSDLTFDDTKARELLGWNPQNVLKYLQKNSI